MWLRHDRTYVLYLTECGGVIRILGTSMEVDEMGGMNGLASPWLSTAAILGYRASRSALPGFQAAPSKPPTPTANGPYGFSSPLLPQCGVQGRICDVRHGLAELAKEDGATPAGRAVTRVAEIGSEQCRGASRLLRQHDRLV